MMQLFFNLSRLLRYSLKSGDEESAQYYKDIIARTVSLYDMGNHMAYMTEAEFYASRKDEDKTLESIRNVMQSIPKLRKTFDSILCKHIYKDFSMDDKKEQEYLVMINQCKKSIISAIKNDEKFAFMKDNEALKMMIKEYESF